MDAVSINESLDHLFRHHAGQMVSVLSRIFGLEKLDLIEDAIQDALIAAMKTWPINGTPDNPKAWLIQVSKNKILDRLRRNKKFSSDETEFEQISIPEFSDDVFFDNEVSEDMLQMMFACCHPAVPPDSQVALTLKTVGGFSVSEIAGAFLANDEAIAKMLTRAKNRLREQNVRLEIPHSGKLVSRQDAVLRVLYLMFNEGYSASTGESLIRADLCHEAIRLARLVAGHQVTRSPKTHALCALFLFQAARLPARLDKEGGLLILEEQDRTQWDKRLVAEGLDHLRLSAGGDELSDYHLEAEIASLHTLAPGFEATNWRRITQCYDELLRRKPSPIIALNRIVALSRTRGAKAALVELAKLRDGKKLQNYAPFFVTKGELEKRGNDPAAALASFTAALKLTNNRPTIDFIARKIADLKLL
jgi:RNA polymerase sigma-70 factor (ECF subfamily)